MAINVPRQYLICYDIADRRRLARVHRYLSGRAVPLQYSVFSALLRQCELNDLMGGIAERIDPREDDVRVYPRPESPRAVTLGRSFLPAGIMLVRKGRDLLIPGAT